MIQTAKYRQVFAHRAFRSFWLGFTVSTLGDAMTRVALTWFVYELTGSPEALGLLAFTYTGPIIIGGFIAGPLLDRFDRRKVMLADSLFRGLVVLLIPLLHATGALALWHIYVVSSIYGLLMMISLAGGPSLVPDLIDKGNLDTANALETISFTLSGVIGPPLAGLLIPLISAPNVVLLDAVTYFAFALALWRMQPPARPEATAVDAQESYRFRDALSLLLKNRVLLSTTLMFMGVNLGFSAILVWLPVLSDQALGGGAELYGLLLGGLAVGEVISSVLAGTLELPLTLGKGIALAQLLAGLALGLMLISLTTPVVLLSLVLFGFVSAPLTIWAQTLRMQIIPERLRGRTFALLRTLMQSGNPVGGAVGGLLLPLLSMPVMIALSAAVVGIPGLIGLQVRDLREADGHGI